MTTARVTTIGERLGRMMLAVTLGVAGLAATVPTTSATPTAAAATDGFVSIAPLRVLDTRDGSGPVEAGDSVTATLSGVPTDAAAAVVNVTASNATGNGYFTVWNCDGPAPATSNGNYVGISTVAANVITELGDDRQICITTGDAAAEIIVDLTGYFTADAGIDMHRPVRVLDTRHEIGPVTPGDVVAVPLAGVPADATAVIVNTTATNAVGDGYFTLWDCDGPAPATSNGNYVGISTIANSAIIEIGTNDRICVTTGDSPADLIVDTFGYLTAVSGYTPITPTRALDTRSADAPIEPGITTTIKVADVPPNNTAIVNVTATEASGDGYFTVWNCEGAIPDTSTGNYVGISTIANSALVSTNSEGEICVRTGQAAAHIIVDSFSYLASPPIPDPRPPSPFPPPPTTTPPTTTPPGPTPPSGAPMILEVAASGSSTIELPLFGTVDVTIDWGQGASAECPTTVASEGLVSCEYSDAFSTTITISPGSGTEPIWLERFGVGDEADDPAEGIWFVTGVTSFGDLGTTSLSGAFWGANDPTMPDDIPSTVTDLSSMFQRAEFFNNGCAEGVTSCPLTWNTLNVTDMSRMFKDAQAFDQNISTWNTANVTDMSGMFQDARAFDQNINGWNTANVTDMSRMFQDARVFDQNISGWNTANVTDMSRMFDGARAFNQNISTWNTTNVTDMSSMFDGAWVFNNGCAAGVTSCPLTWNTLNVTDMSSMFQGTQAFDQAIGTWNTANVTDMASMFSSALAFDQPIGTWNTAEVTDMEFMFYEAAAFNQNIRSWITTNVENMSDMFRFEPDSENSSVFNNGCAAGVTSCPLTWDTGKVTSMIGMFEGAEAFDQAIGTWNTANVTNMGRMFQDALAFDQDIGGWNTANVSNMSRMFRNAVTFNQNLSGWCVTNVTSLGRELFDEGATAWLLPNSRPVWGTCPG